MNVYKSYFSPEPIQDYINKFSLRLTNEQKQLIDRTLKNPRSMMLGSADEAQFFQFLLKSINAKNVIELGCFTGYTTLTIALALPNDGKIITCDINDQHVAKDIWREAGVDHKIHLKLGPASNSLKELLENGREGHFDFAFIDADKDNQMEYYELCLRLVRRGGIIAIDNVLWGGAVADLRINDDTTNNIRELNEYVKNDNRVEISMLRLGDGTTLCYKK